MLVALALPCCPWSMIELDHGREGAVHAWRYGVIQRATRSHPSAHIVSVSDLSDVAQPIGPHGTVRAMARMEMTIGVFRGRAGLFPSRGRLVEKDGVDRPTPSRMAHGSAPAVRPDGGISFDFVACRRSVPAAARRTSVRRASRQCAPSSSGAHHRRHLPLTGKEHYRFFSCRMPGVPCTILLRQAYLAGRLPFFAEGSLLGMRTDCHWNGRRMCADAFDNMVNGIHVVSVAGSHDRRWSI